MLGQGLLVFLSLGYLAVLLLLARRETAQAIVDSLVAKLPERAATLLGGAFRRLIDGLGIMASAKQALLIFACSLCVWVLFAGLTYLFLMAFSIDAPILVAITIQVVLCFGVALPSAPGFVGTFHAAGRYGLELFGIAAIPAISFATVYHFFNLAGSVLLGAVSYWTGKYTFDQAMIGLQDSAESPAK
jgi:uncharacterized protein (TIRG00374 family)